METKLYNSKGKVVGIISIEKDRYVLKTKDGGIVMSAPTSNQRMVESIRTLLELN